MTRRKRSTMIVLLTAAALLIIAGVAWAASTFPDVDPSDTHAAAIEWAAENGIVNGYANGNFGPYDPILRGQAATMFQNYDEYLMGKETAPLAAIRRGCPACHPTVVGDPSAPPFTPGRPDPSRGNAPTFSLKWEAMGGDATSTEFLLHGTLPDTAGIATCLGCHAAGSGDQNGNGAPIGLRTIVHPAHLNSGIFLAEFRGNCFTCHEITNSGEYGILSLKVEVDDAGIPMVIPTPGLLEPSGPDDSPTSTTTTTETPPTTTSSTTSTSSTTTSSS